MNFDRMREVILDKAVRGELVSQLAEDGVVAQIGNTPKEELFQIPKSWKWCSLNMVAQVIAGQSPKGTALTTDSNDTEFHQGKTFFGRQYIQNSGAYTNEPTKIAPKESILLSVRAPVGAVNLTDRKICIGRGLFAIVPNDQLLVKFLYFVLLTKARELQSKSTGTTFKAVTGKVVRDLYVPVPPLKEQARIVDKVSDALEEIDRAEKAYEELQTLAGVLRGQILQEAIKGKLVPQLAEEGVVEHIGAAPDEVPFEIPESWQWVQLNRICTLKSGVDMSPSVLLNEPVVDSIPYITGGSQIGQSGELLITRWTSKATNISEKGDVLLICKGSGLGRTALNSYGSVHIARQIMAIRKTKEAIPQYLDLLLKWRWESLRSAAKGVIPGISRKDVLSLLVPLPPVTEQVRIVAKVDDLLKQVNALSA